jgi:hypothetical protein
MEIRVKGKGIEISGGADLESPESMEYGFTEIESLRVLDDDENEVFDSQCETFKMEAIADLDFNGFDEINLEHEDMEFVWFEIDEWNPDLFVIEYCTFSTPEGDFKIYTPRYDDQCEDEMIPL